MLILAIDTATRQAGVALVREDEVLAEYTWSAGLRHTQHTAPMIDQALRQAGVAPDDLEGVAVTRGPGSFTGLRIGLSLAKGFAAALGIPVVAIPTLDVCAFPHFYGETPVRAVLRAGRGRYAFATYRREAPDRWRPVGEPQLARLPQLVEDVQQPMRFVGELGAQEQAVLKERGGRWVRFVPPPFNVRRPSVLAFRALERFQRGEHDDVDTLAPFYLHIPEGAS